MITSGNGKRTLLTTLCALRDALPELRFAVSACRGISSVWTRPCDPFRFFEEFHYSGWGLRPLYLNGVRQDSHIFWPDISSCSIDGASVSTSEFKEYVRAHVDRKLTVRVGRCVYRICNTRYSLDTLIRGIQELDAGAVREWSVSGDALGRGG